MNIGRGEDINQRVFEKLNEIERKKIGKRIEKCYPQYVLRSFPDNQIMNANQAISYLENKTNLDQVIIRNCLSELISRKELIPAKDTCGRLHLSKMKKIY